jgi:hypothetical protein
VSGALPFGALPVRRRCSASPVAGRVLNDSIQHAELIKARLTPPPRLSLLLAHAASHCCSLMPRLQGKGAPQLWLVGVSSQIVCISSADLTSILLRAENSGQKPDVTSFFDGFISLLPVASVPMASGTRHHGGKSGGPGVGMPADAAPLQQFTSPTARGNFSSRPATAAPSAAAAFGQPSHHEPDIRQLKHVLDSISTTKTMAKISLMQQASVTPRYQWLNTCLSC